MQKLTTSIQKGDLKPKERVLLLLHDAINKERTGKEILTEADRHALSDGWRPENNREVDEYNRYNNGWRTETFSNLDAQTIYLNAQISLLQASKLVSYVMCKEYKDGGSYFKGTNLGVNEGEDIDFVVKNTGLVFDRVVYGYAFQNLSENLKKDLLTLYPDIETESHYLDQEEITADLLDGKKQLTAEAREKLTSLIIEAMHNKYAKAMTEKGLRSDEWWFQGYFADLPCLEIVKKWADYNGINCKSDSEKLNDELAEKIQSYAKDHEVSVRDLLRNTISRWLDEGLFAKEYSPLWNNDGKATCNGADTKIPHRKVFQKWLKAKNEARAIIQKLVDNGQLKVGTRDNEFLGAKETVKIITGESLYNFQGDLAFVGDFKKQVDCLKPLGWLIVFLKRQDFLKYYASLLRFADIHKKLSAIYEVDLGYRIDKFINNFKEGVEQLNNELSYIADKLEGAIHQKHDLKFSIELFANDMLIRLDEIKPGTDETEEHYYNEFKKILSDEF